MRVDCSDCVHYNHEEGDYNDDICPDCSEYCNTGESQCYCHINPPCSYCVDLRFEERGEINGLYNHDIQEEVV